MAKRLNIGLFIDELDNNFTMKACQGAELGAQAIDANLYLFPGKYLDSAEVTDEKLRYEYQYNTVFEYANEKNLDLLFVMMGTIGCRTDFDKQKAFLDRFSRIPIATLFTKLDGYASVTFNNRIGFEQEIRHLIEHHGIKNIGLVSGPMTNMDAVERYEVFRNVLKDKGLSFSEKQVVFGDFEEHSDDCVRTLMQKNPDLEAVVFANDMMALGGYRVFKEMGLEIGRDILVVGFDNSREAVTMMPPLTTVDANPIELTYRAVLHARDFLETGKLENIEVNTHFVRRQSCGCRAFDYEAMAERLDLTDLMQRENINVEQIHQYLFGGYFVVNELLKIKDNLAVFLKMLFEAVKKRKLSEYKKDILVIFNQIIEQPLLQYTHTERFFNVLTSLQYEYSRLLETEREKMILMSIFSQIYRSLAIHCSQMVQGQQEQIEQIAQMINTMTGDIFILDSEEKISYDLALAKLQNLGIRSAYLYTFEDMIRQVKGDTWEMPKTVMLKALCNSRGARVIPLEKQAMRINRLLYNMYLPKNRRMTMVVSPLFSGEEQYGVLLTDLSYESLNVVAPIASQLSAALKSLHLIEKQQFVQKQLEESIEKFKESNDFLNEISRSDELTGLYNRRGFLEYAHAAITNKRNVGRRALVAYADMDNLKMINDNYGHDEGDFALREIAGILKDTFRSTDIVARFGGDEFVAFAMVGVENYENIMRRRINEITIRHNEEAKKPYPIEMSVGIWEFECGPEVDLYEILDIADELLYKDKNEKKRKNGSYR